MGQPAFKDGARFRAGFDRSAGAHRLQAMLEKSGSLDRDAVIKEARRSSSPLHAAFVWDAEEALTHSHEITAQHLLSNFVHVTIADDGRREEIRAVLPVRILEDDDDRVYKSRDEVMSNLAWRVQALAQAKNDLYAFQRKYSSLKELASVFAAIESLKGEDHAAA